MSRISLVSRLCRSREFVRAKFDQPIQLIDMAREAGLSAYHFHRQFRTTFDETPQEFLTRVRLMNAQQLLLRDDRPVTQICFDVGFSSLGSFSTLFSRRVGVSPAQFRRKAQILVPAMSLRPWLFVPDCFVAMYGGGAPNTQLP